MKSGTVSRSIDLSHAIVEAASCINHLYPLTNFVACNSLKGYENIYFEEAMRKAKELFNAKGFLPLAEYRAMYESGRIAPEDLDEAFKRHNKRKRSAVQAERKRLSVSEMLDTACGTNIVDAVNKQMIKWCSSYLDQTQAQWAPVEKKSLFKFWKQLARHDKSLWWHGIRNFAKTVGELPDDSEEALNKQLRELEICGEDVAPYLRRHFVQFPGFASYLKWRSDNHDSELLRDYLAIRLHYEQVFSKFHAQQRYKSKDLGLIRSLLESEIGSSERERASTSDDEYAPVWQEAYELNYRDKLLSKLNPQFADRDHASDCQLVFCIDVRSEPIRRELESLGSYSTYGFAGFFGMPMRFNEVGSAFSLDLCPVLIKPEKVVKETLGTNLVNRRFSWQALKTAAILIKKKIKSSVAGAFGLVELIGLYSAVPLAFKTFFPSGTKALNWVVEQLVEPSYETTLDLSSFSLQDKVSFAKGAIAGIGLKRFSKLIVLCGHKSSSGNNPYASSLDCGACGGNGGAFSARLAAEILNDEKVRAVLAADKISIKQNTVFVAAEHDTTTDKVTLFKPKFFNEEQSAIFAKLRQDLNIAGDAVREKRSQSLPKSSMARLNDPIERACDWAQVAPEWGLAGNAAFIAAPRALSSGSDLEGRVFLHSYDCELDSNNKVLELIMSAPLVVAQWINAQYYLSTVDNEKFGSGTKVLHNVVGDFGVMTGAASDLRLGLPMQSVNSAGRMRHEPMRLLAVINARRSAIEEALQKHAEVAQLVTNRWIRLVALEPDDMRFYELSHEGDWYQISRKANQPGVKCLANA